MRSWCGVLNDLCSMCNLVALGLVMELALQRSSVLGRQRLAGPGPYPAQRRGLAGVPGLLLLLAQRFSKGCADVTPSNGMHEALRPIISGSERHL